MAKRTPAVQNEQNSALATAEASLTSASTDTTPPAETEVKPEADGKPVSGAAALGLTAEDMTPKKAPSTLAAEELCTGWIVGLEQMLAKRDLTGAWVEPTIAEREARVLAYKAEHNVDLFSAIAAVNAELTNERQDKVLARDIDLIWLRAARNQAAVLLGIIDKRIAETGAITMSAGTKVSAKARAPRTTESATAESGNGGNGGGKRTDLAEVERLMLAAGCGALGSREWKLTVRNGRVYRCSFSGGMWVTEGDGWDEMKTAITSALGGRTGSWHRFSGFSASNGAVMVDAVDKKSLELNQIIGWGSTERVATATK